MAQPHLHAIYLEVVDEFILSVRLHAVHLETQAEFKNKPILHAAYGENDPATTPERVRVVVS